MFNKLLIVLFVLLLFVVVWEFVYFARLPNQSSQPIAQLKETVCISPTIIPEKMQENIQNRYGDYRDWLTKRNTVLVSSLMTDVSIGTIKNIENFDADTQKIIINGQKGTYPFYITNTELKTTKISSLSGIKEITIPFSELKVKDVITIKEVFDYKSPQILRISLEIVKK